MRYRAIPVGVSQYLVPRVADGSSALPYSLTIIPLNNTQCTSITKNPYVFSPHTISKFSLLLNSKMIPAKPISVKKKVEENVRCYRHFLENTGFADTNTSNGIEPFSYLNHDFCMTWDLTGNHLQHCLFSHLFHYQAIFVWALTTTDLKAVHSTSPWNLNRLFKNPSLS